MLDGAAVVAAAADCLLLHFAGLPLHAIMLLAACGLSDSAQLHAASGPACRDESIQGIKDLVGLIPRAAPYLSHVIARLSPLLLGRPITVLLDI